MDPITLAIGGNLLMSYLGNKQKNENEKKNMLANAAAIQYSPWTHMKTEMSKTSEENPWLAMAGGAMNGYLQGSLYNKQFPQAPAQTPNQQADAQMKTIGAAVDNHFNPQVPGGVPEPGAAPQEAPFEPRNYIPAKNEPLDLSMRKPSYYGSPWSRMG